MIDLDVIAAFLRDILRAALKEAIACVKVWGSRAYECDYEQLAGDLDRLRAALNQEPQ